MELLHVNPWNSAQHIVNNERNYVSRHDPIYTLNLVDTDQGVQNQ